LIPIVAISLSKEMTAFASELPFDRARGAIEKPGFDLQITGAGEASAAGRRRSRSAEALQVNLMLLSVKLSP
jgi:hypothetical protein